jgi:hypothetical protein
VGCRTAALAVHFFAHAEHTSCIVGILDPQRRLQMPDLNPFGMEFDGDVDGIDFLGVG